MAIVGGGAARDGTTIFEFNAESSVDLLAYRWKGKLNLLPRPAAFTYCQVKAADYADLTLRLYADGSQILERAVTSKEPFTLPMLDEYESAEIELVGTSRVRTVQVAEDIAEIE